MKKLFLMVAGLLLLMTYACSEEEIEYVPIGKKHLGETFETYTINNVSWTDSIQVVVLNFYPEDHRGETADYRIAWDYDTEGSYVEVQYGQNAMWYTVNEQRHKGNISCVPMMVWRSELSCVQTGMGFMRMGR